MIIIEKMFTLKLRWMEIAMRFICFLRGRRHFDAESKRFVQYNNFDQGHYSYCLHIFIEIFETKITNFILCESKQISLKKYWLCLVLFSFLYSIVIFLRKCDGNILRVY